MRTSRSGFTPVEVVVVVVVMSVMVGLGVVAYQRFNTQPAAAPAATTEDAAADIRSTEDLDTVSKELDGIIFDQEADINALDTAANAF